MYSSSRETTKSGIATSLIELSVLGSDFDLNDKDSARNFFNQMRQKFIDWNYTEFESEAFKKAETEIDALYRQGDGKLAATVEKLLKDGD